MLRQLQTVKVIAGLACLVAALPLVPFAWVSFRWGELWFKLVPILIMLGSAAVGLFLILKRRQAMPKQVKLLIVLFLVILVASPALLIANIRHDRRLLKGRAKAFLSHPVPMALKPNSEGYMGYE